MKKAVKTFIIILMFLGVFPALAGLGVTALWNGILTTACGFATIGFWEGTGLFLLGQLLSGGFVLGLFLIGGGIHAAGHHHSGWQKKWHAMTDQQRQDFIARRRRHFVFTSQPDATEDASN